MPSIIPPDFTILYHHIYLQLRTAINKHILHSRECFYLNWVFQSSQQEHFKLAINYNGGRTGGAVWIEKAQMEKKEKQKKKGEKAFIIVSYDQLLSASSVRASDSPAAPFAGLLGSVKRTITALQFDCG